MTRYVISGELRDALLTLALARMWETERIRSVIQAPGIVSPETLEPFIADEAQAQAHFQELLTLEPLPDEPGEEES